MRSTQNTSPDDKSSDDIDLQAAVDRIRKNTETMLRYFDLSRRTLSDLLQIWTARKKEPIREVLHQLHELRDNKNIDELATSCRNVLIGGTIGIGTDLFDSWIKTLLVLHRNFHVMRTDFGEQAERVSDLLKETTGYDPLHPIRESVSKGYRNAMSPPAVNWSGAVEIEIGLKGGVNLVTLNTDGRAVLPISDWGEYDISVTFVPGTKPTVAGLAVAIEDGEPATTVVPFELRVDFSLTREAVRRKKIEVPPRERSEAFHFEFLMEKTSRLEPDYPISVAVYQHGLHYGTSLIEVINQT